MIICAFETSCDDTCVAILRCINGEKIVLSNIRYQQNHNDQGGIIPELASQLHLNNIDIILKQALSEAQLQISEIDVYAATIGPGLIPSLVIGYNFALTLSKIFKKTFIPVHHLEGHIRAYEMIEDLPDKFLSFIISGGHSSIYEYKNNEFCEIARTIDDAAGELFDKVGRIIGLNFPAGADMEKLAKLSKFNTMIIKPKIDIPMLHQANLSFSGLKTKFIRLYEQNIYPKEDIAFLLQDVVARTIVHKLLIGLKDHDIKNIYICGGVASNLYIRNYVQEHLSDYDVYYPPINLCVDNALMIAVTALNSIKQKSHIINLKTLDVFARLKIEDFYQSLLD